MARSWTHHDVGRYRGNTENQRVYKRNVQNLQRRVYGCFNGGLGQYRKSLACKNTGVSIAKYQYYSYNATYYFALKYRLWAQIIRTSFLLRQVGTISHELREDPAHLHAFLDTSKVLGALFLPDDGIVNPADVCLAVANRAREAGAHILEHVEVTNFNRSSSGSIQSVVVNSESEIECDHVVLACGQWTSQLCRNHLSVHIPTAIVPHQYAIFDKIQGVDNTLPVIRDYASRTYMKPEVGSFAVGTFESPHSMMPAICASRNNGNLIPRDAQNELFDNVPMEKQGGGLEAAMELLPSIAEVGLKTCIHGPDTHSADHAPIVGFVGDTVPNLLVGTGFNSQGIQAGVGIGAVLADLICETRTIDEDVSFMDPRRFSPDVSADTTWCTERALEGYAETYVSLSLSCNRQKTYTTKHTGTVFIIQTWSFSAEEIVFSRVFTRA